MKNKRAAPAATPERISTRAQAEAHIKSQARTCRGKQRQDWSAVKSEMAGGGRFPAPAAALNDVKAVPKSISTTREAVTWLLQEGRLEGARAVDAFARPPCGADLNPQIAAGPHDGKDHKYVCPQCGQEGWYTAPVYPDVRSA